MKHSTKHSEASAVSNLSGARSIALVHRIATFAFALRWPSRVASGDIAALPCVSWPCPADRVWKKALTVSSDPVWRPSPANSPDTICWTLFRYTWALGEILVVLYRKPLWRKEDESKGRRRCARCQKVYMVMLQNRVSHHSDDTRK